MRHSIWITLLILFIYFLSYAGIPHSIDEMATIATSESILHGSLQLNRMEWEQRRYPPQNAFGPDGNLYSKKGLGSSLVALPFLLIGKKWESVGAVQFTFLSTALITALTVFTFYHLVVSLGYTDDVAIVATLALGLGTLLWPYAKMLFSEPIAAFGVCLALFGIVRFSHDTRSLWLLLCSVGLATLTLARSANAILVVPFAGIVAYNLGADFRQNASWQRLLLAGVSFCLPFGASVLGICLYNYVRFHTFFSFPLVPGESFTTPLHIGVPGLLWSSGKGLLFYVPLTWMIAFSYVVAWRKMRTPAYLVALAAILIALFFFGRWYDWPGGKAWGPRFLVPTMPAIVMLCLPALDWLTESRPRWKRWFLVSWLSLTVLAQLPGILINFEYQENLDGLAFQDLVWKWQYSPLLTYWDKVFTGAEDPVWFHPFFWSNSLWLLGLIGALGISILTLHLRQGIELRRQSRQQPSRYRLAWLGLLTGLFGISLVIASRPDPRWWERSDSFASSQAVRAWIDQQASAADIVLLDLRNGYDAPGRIWEWTNFSSLHPDYIGWLRKTHLTEADKEHLQDWLAAHGRVWLSLQATDSAAPDSTTENWLRQWAYEGQSHWIETQRVVEYIVPTQIGETLGSGTASWFQADALQVAYTVRRGYSPNHILIDLFWTQSVPRDLKFSIQALDSQLQLRQQIDRLPTLDSGNHDRVGMYLTAPDLKLILKAYNGATGEVYPVQFENNLTAEFWTLAEIP